MKKLFVLMFSALALWGCDNTKPGGEDEPVTDLGITGIELPPATGSFGAGDVVGIKGDGFKAGDLIRGTWSGTRANLKPSAPSFDVAVTLTREGISFVVPEVTTAGKYALSAVRSDVGVQSLGSISIKSGGQTAGEYLLFGAGCDAETSKYGVWALSAQGESKIIFSFDDDTSSENIFYDPAGKKVWGITETSGQKGLGYIDVEKKEAFFSPYQDNIQMFGLYQGALAFLYTPSSDPDELRLGKFNDNGDGTLVQLKSFGTVGVLKNAEVDSTVFVYDASSKSIVVAYSDWTTSEGSMCYLMALNTETGQFAAGTETQFDHIYPFTKDGSLFGLFYNSEGNKTYVQTISVLGASGAAPGTNREATLDGHFRSPVWVDGKLYALKTDSTTEESDLYTFDSAWTPSIAASGSMPEWVFEITAGK